MWIDFRGIQDAYLRGRGSDYFENSRRATYVHQQYAIRNPLEFEGYGEHCWGLTACFVQRARSARNHATARFRRRERSLSSSLSASLPWPQPANAAAQAAL